MTFEQIDKAFKSESMDLVMATEKQVMAYCDRTNCGDAYSRWVDYQEELRHLMAEFQ